MRLKTWTVLTIFRCVQKYADQLLDSGSNSHQRFQDRFRLFALGVHLKIAVTACFIAGDALLGAKHRSPKFGDQLGFAQPARSDRFGLGIQVVHELMIERQGRLFGQTNFFAADVVDTEGMTIKRNIPDCANA